MPPGGIWERLGAVVAAAMLQVVAVFWWASCSCCPCVYALAQALLSPCALQQQVGDRVFTVQSVLCWSVCTHCELFVCLRIA